MVDVSYKFLDADLAAQEETATTALELAKQIDSKIQAARQAGQITINITPAELELYRNGYIQVFDKLVANVTSTAELGAAFGNLVIKKST